MAEPTISILTRELCHEGEPVKGSRFIATAAPIGSADELEPILRRCREAFPEANHHCWAYRLGPRGDEYRFSDDGEPGGSAGRPILQRLEGRGVTDAAIVVTRIFGGTKLGVGGLIRAYGGAAGMVLDRAELLPRIVRRAMRVVVPYADAGAVERAVAAAGLTPTTVDYAAEVTLHAEVPEDDVQRLITTLRDATAGRAVIELDD